MDRKRIEKKDRKHSRKSRKGRRIQEAEVAIVMGSSDGKVFLSYGLRKKKTLSMRTALGVEPF